VYQNEKSRIAKEQASEPFGDKTAGSIPTTTYGYPSPGSGSSVGGVRGLGYLGNPKQPTKGITQGSKRMTNDRGNRAKGKNRGGGHPTTVATRACTEQRNSSPAIGRLVTLPKVVPLKPKRGICGRQRLSNIGKTYSGVAKEKMGRQRRLQWGLTNNGLHHVPAIANGSVLKYSQGKGKNKVTTRKKYSGEKKELKTKRNEKNFGGFPHTLSCRSCGHRPR